MNTVLEQELSWVLFNEVDNLGIITLNRKQALNALSIQMLESIAEQLNKWAVNKAIKAVVIRANKTCRAFCAGGDLREIYFMGQMADQDPADYFRAEYSLNHQIKMYSKPCIALLDGITMGGGAGISINASIRIATERFIFAMPEIDIGFYPDAGGSYFLSHCPNYMGSYLGLTGARITAADASYLGLVNQFLASEQLEEYLELLINKPFTDNSDIVNLLTHFNPSNKLHSQLKEKAELINHCFSQDSIETIIEQLHQQTDPWCLQTVEHLQQRCPLSLKITLEVLKRASQMNFTQCMQQEFFLTQRFVQEPNFYEGIRALIIDKDKVPRWQPATLNAVSDELVQSYFSINDKSRLFL